MARTLSAERKHLYCAGQTALKGDPPKRGRSTTLHNYQSCYCWWFDKGRSKSQRSWNWWRATDIANSTHYSWNHLRFKLVKCLLTGFQKCSSWNTKTKEWLICFKIFAYYQEEGELFVESIIMGDEICVYEWPQSQKETTWLGKHPYLSITKKFKIEPPEEKMWLLWDCEGLLLCHFLPPTINCDK
jgi:hypothetical protein